MENHIKIQTEDFNHTELVAWMQQDPGKRGAMVTFTGIVRDTIEEDLESLFLEHYAGMTEKCLTKIADKARDRWQLGRVSIVHRVGLLHNNDNIVFVGVVSAHRLAAFEASQFIMDYLKKEAPFWKKENTRGSNQWLEQKDSDLQAAAKWGS
jgi:molybdopterin synthase catalytic subunit